MSEDSRPTLPTPVVSAILLCDQAIRNEITERVTLVGILNRITSETFPFQHRRGVTLYASYISAQLKDPPKKVSTEGMYPTKEACATAALELAKANQGTEEALPYVTTLLSAGCPVSRRPAGRP